MDEQQAEEFTISVESAEEIYQETEIHSDFLFTVLKNYIQMFPEYVFYITMFCELYSINKRLSFMVSDYIDSHPRITGELEQEEILLSKKDLNLLQQAMITRYILTNELLDKTSVSLATN